jgi:hypothetical protein
MLDRLTQKHDRTPLAIPLRQNFLKHDRIAKDTLRPGVKHVPVKWLAIKFKDMNGMLFGKRCGDAILTAWRRQGKFREKVRTAEETEEYQGRQTE